MIKQFLKLLKLVLLPYHNIKGSTYAFLDKVFIRFSIPTKIFIDQGM